MGYYDQRGRFVLIQIPGGSIVRSNVWGGRGAAFFFQGSTSLREEPSASGPAHLTDCAVRPPILRPSRSVNSGSVCGARTWSYHDRKSPLPESLRHPTLEAS